MKSMKNVKRYLLALLFGLLFVCAAAAPVSASSKTSWKKLYGNALKKKYLTYTYKTLNSKGKAVSKSIKVYPSYTGTRYRTVDIDQDGTPELLISQTYDNGTSALYVFRIKNNKVRSCYLAGSDLSGDYGLIRKGTTTQKITYSKSLHALDITYTYSYTKKKSGVKYTVTQTKRSIFVLKGRVFSTYAYAMSLKYVPVETGSASSFYKYYVWLKKGEYTRTTTADTKLDYSPSKKSEYKTASAIVFKKVTNEKTYKLLKNNSTNRTKTFGKKYA